MMPPLSSTSRVMKIGITSDELNMREMSVVAYWKIRQELLRVDGVANVAIWGSTSNRSMWRSIHRSWPSTACRCSR